MVQSSAWRTTSLRLSQWLAKLVGGCFSLLGGLWFASWCHRLIFIKEWRIDDFPSFFFSIPPDEAILCPPEGLSTSLIKFSLVGETRQRRRSWWEFLVRLSGKIKFSTLWILQDATGYIFFLGCTFILLCPIFTTFVEIFVFPSCKFVKKPVAKNLLKSS